MNKDFFLYRHAWRYNGAPDREPQLSDSQCKELLKNGGWMVRNTFDFDCEEETDFWYIIKDSFGGMEELGSNVRRKIRRADSNFEYKLVDNEKVKGLGYPIIEAAYADYKVKDRDINKQIFEEYLEDCKHDNFDYWGVYNKDKQELIGFCTVHIWGNSCEYGIMVVKPEFKRNGTYPFYGLFYRMNDYYLEELNFKYVTDSARSITEHSNIQPFLEQNFKFRKAYCKLKLHYKWWFGMIVRLLYPFRNVIPNRNIQAVLKMHGMQTE